MNIWHALATATGLLTLYYVIDLLRIYYLARCSGCKPAPALSRWSLKRAILEALHLVKPAALQQTRVVDAPRRFREVGGNTYSRDNGIQRVFVTADAENIKALLGHSDDWGVEPMRMHSMGPFLGRGLLTSDGLIWKRSRVIIRPSLSKVNVKDVSKLRVHMDRLIGMLPRDGSAIDVQPLLFQLFSDSSQEFILGRSSGIFLSGDQTLPSVYLPAFRQAVMNMSMRLDASWFQLCRPNPTQARNNKLLHDIVDELIETQLPEIEKAEKTSKKAKTMLETVASLTQDRLEIRNQMMQGILASQDTIATFASNVLFLLARNLSVWQELCAKLLEIKNSPNLSDDLRKLSLLQNVLFEFESTSELSSYRIIHKSPADETTALRLLPVFPALGRAALRDTILPTGGGPDGKSKIFVPAGGRVIPYLYVLHRNPELFGENPEVFDPSRWSRVPDIHANYMAFGYGARSCLGQDKAVYEGSYMLWRFAKVFPIIKPGNDKRWNGIQYLTCQNENGCLLAFPS